MRIPLISELSESIQAKFPVSRLLSEAKNFIHLRNSFSFSVWKPKHMTSILAREQVISHYLAENYYQDEYHRIVHGYKLSAITNEAVTADLLRGDLPDHPVPKDEHYWNALIQVTQAFEPDHKLKPVHLADMRLYPWNKSTNVEAPFSHEAKYQRIKQSMYEQGLIPDLKNSFHNFQDIVFYVTRIHLHIIKNGDAFRPPIGASDGFYDYFTTHAKSSVVPVESHDKIRMIFGAPKLFIIAEAMFFWPLFAYHMNRDEPFPILWNYAILSGGWLRLNAEFHYKYMQATTLMFDLQQFDKRALYSVFDDIVTGWYEYFDFENGYQPTIFNSNSYANPTRLRNLWNWLENARKHIPVLLPDGRILGRLHRGVPSGLFTTQFLDSVYNAIMIVTILSALGIRINIKTMLKLMGDDSLARIPVFIPPNLHDDFKSRCATLLLYYFDSVLNQDKSKITPTLEGAEVLSYENRNGLPHRDEIELAARFYHTNSNKPTPDITMSQCIGTAYALADPSCRLYQVCKSVYTHYADLGFTASSPITSKDIYVYGTPSLPTSFPTPEEVVSRLLTPSTRSKEIADKYWPRWFFLNDP
jgi:hypothetical protein